MSRVIFKKNRTKHASISSPSISSNISSASELSYLKAQVWSLLNHLREEKVSTKNLSVRNYIIFCDIMILTCSFRNRLKNSQMKNMNYSKNWQGEIFQWKNFKRNWIKRGYIAWHKSQLELSFISFFVLGKSMISLWMRMKHCRKKLISIALCWWGFIENLKIVTLFVTGGK